MKKRSILLLGLVFVAIGSSRAWAQASKPVTKKSGGGQQTKASEARKGRSDAKAKDDKDATDEEKKAKTEKAVFGGGCFWCLEAVYERINGVKNVVSGYSGGYIRRPSYDLVLTGETGHAEVVEIEYDPAEVTYDELLKVFWVCHDPTSLNAQGPDFGTQYRSIILYRDDAQKAAVGKSLVEAQGMFNRPIVTEVVPLKVFYPAEKYHQDYYRKHRYAPYCQANITPKLEALKIKFSHPDDAAVPVEEQPKPRRRR